MSAIACACGDNHSTFGRCIQPSTCSVGNDDTRAFPSIPARHDLWRRASADWIAGLLVRGLIDEDDAQEMVFDCTTRLAREAYRL